MSIVGWVLSLALRNPFHHHMGSPTINMNTTTGASDKVYQSAGCGGADAVASLLVLVRAVVTRDTKPSGLWV